MKKIKFLAIMTHYRFMGHQSYVLLCSKITSFPPSEGEFSEKLGISSKWKKFQNPSCYILGEIKQNYDKKFFWLSWCIKELWGTKVMYCYVVKWRVFRLQRGSAKTPFAPSSQDLHELAQLKIYVGEAKINKYLTKNIWGYLLFKSLTKNSEILHKRYTPPKKAENNRHSDLKWN